MTGTKEMRVGKTTLVYKGKTYVYHGWHCSGKILLLDRAKNKEIKLTKKEFQDEVQWH